MIAVIFKRVERDTASGVSEIGVSVRMRPLPGVKHLNRRQIRHLGLLSTIEKNDRIFVDFDFVGRPCHRWL